jgi:thymidine phosphorylase
VHRIYRLLAGQGEAARADAVSLNAGLLFYLAGRAATIAAGVVMAARLLGEGQALAVLRRWVSSQNRKPQQGLAILEQLARQEGNNDQALGGERRKWLLPLCRRSPGTGGGAPGESFSPPK